VVRSLVVEADGGSRGNPGKAGYGALVRDAGSGAVLAERAASVGIASNNVAEYSGLVAGLSAALEIDPGADVEVRMDSKLVVEQMSGRWKIKHEDMRRLAAQAARLVAKASAAGGSVRFSWIPRAENAAADRLANAAMDGFTISRRLDGGGASDADRGDARSVTSAVSVQPAAVLSPGGRTPARTRLVLVRHGVTDFTVAGRLDGRGGTDPPLNELGRDQVRRAGSPVATLAEDDSAVTGPVVVLTSSLTRARETGAALAAVLGARTGAGADIEVDSDWDEQDFGDWDGESVGRLAARCGPELQRFREDPEYARPGGETHAALAARVLAAFDRATARAGTVVVATHRKPLLVVLAHVLGIPHDRIWRLATAPASLTGVEVWQGGRVSVSFVNETLHLR